MGTAELPLLHLDSSPLLFPPAFLGSFAFFGVEREDTFSVCSSSFLLKCSLLKRFSFEGGDASESEKPLSVDLFGDAAFPPSFHLLLVCALVMGGVAGHVTPMGSPIVMGRVIPILLETPTLTLDSPSLSPNGH